MKNLKEFGATRITMILLVLNACGLSWYSLIFYPDSVFTPVFALISNITSGVIGYFIAKSTQDGKENSITVTKSQDIKPIDPAV